MYKKAYGSVMSLPVQVKRKLTAAILNTLKHKYFDYKIRSMGKQNYHGCGLNLMNCCFLAQWYIIAETEQT